MTAPTEPTPAPAPVVPATVVPAAVSLTFAQAAAAMAKTKTGRQVGRALRVLAFAGLTFTPQILGVLAPDQQALFTSLVVPTLEVVYRGFKDPA